MDISKFTVTPVELGTFLDTYKDHVRDVGQMYAKLDQLENKKYYVGAHDVVRWSEDRLDPDTITTDDADKFFSAMLKEYPGSETTIWLVTDMDNQVVGFAITRIFDYSIPKSINLLAIYIIPSHRRSGIGSLILNKICEYADKFKLVLWTVAAFLNEDAIRFYNKNSLVSSQVNLFRQPISV